MLNTRHKKSLLHPFTKLCLSILSPEIHAVLESKGEYQYMTNGFAVAFWAFWKWTLNIYNWITNIITYSNSISMPLLRLLSSITILPSWATLGHFEKWNNLSNRRDRQKDGIWWNLGRPIDANQWSSHRVGFKPQEPLGTCSFQILCCPKIQWIYLSKYLNIYLSIYLSIHLSIYLFI